jgi:pimeloyl-ACP methyl ester carboxylesterase
LKSGNSKPRTSSGFIECAAWAFAVATLFATVGAAAQDDHFGPFVVGEQGVLYEGGTYDDPASPTTMSGQMQVFYQIPAGSEHESGIVPIVMIHGSQQTGANFLGTPDGRPGWAAFFVSHGWPVYVIDQPGRGKSGYFPNAYGAQAANPSPTTVIRMFTAPELSSPLQWPQAALHTQWPGGPGSGVPGEYAFDQFFSSQVANMPDGNLALSLTTAAVTRLLDRIGPAVIITHSMSGPLSWMIPQANPGKIRAIIAVEPTGNSSLNGDVAPGTACGLSNVCLNFTPAINGPADLGLTRVPAPSTDLKSCWLQTEPAHTLPWLNGIPILIATGEASYHSTYDYCTSKFLTQAKVPNQWVYLPTVGIHGNGHMQMLEMNNLEIARFYRRWLTSKLLSR